MDKVVGIMPVLKRRSQCRQSPIERSRLSKELADICAGSNYTLVINHEKCQMFGKNYHLCICVYDIGIYKCIGNYSKG